MTREEKIIALVSENQKIEVNELAEMLGVSKVTIRKDLNDLEKRGILHREHGFAVINSQDDINYRLAQNYDLKKKIALAAAKLVADGETVMIESGSSCTLLAEELAFNRKDITIITNSCFIATYLRKSKTAKVILLGGEFQKASQVNVGPLVKLVVGEFYVDKFFVGIDGFDERRGFTGSDIARCDTDKVMMTAAKETIVLTDSSKFDKVGVVTNFKFNEVAKVFTDKGITAERKKFLKGQGVEVLAV